MHNPPWLVKAHTLFKTTLEFTRFSYKDHNFNLFTSKNTQSGLTTQMPISMLWHTLIHNFDHQALSNSNLIHFKPFPKSHIYNQRYLISTIDLEKQGLTSIEFGQWSNLIWANHLVTKSLVDQSKSLQIQ